MQELEACSSVASARDHFNLQLEQRPEEAVASWASCKHYKEQTTVDLEGT